MRYEPIVTALWCCINFSIIYIYGLCLEYRHQYLSYRVPALYISMGVVTYAQWWQYLENEAAGRASKPNGKRTTALLNTLQPPFMADSEVGRLGKELQPS